MPERHGRDRRPMRVLIADDSPSFRRELRTLLELEADIEVVGEAADGWEAIEKTDVLQPDTVLMDQNMPSLSGLDATRQIKETHPHTRILFVAAEDTWREDALAEGAEAYFIKDADLDALILYLRTAAQLVRQETAPDTVRAPRTQGRAALQDTSGGFAVSRGALRISILIWLIGGASVVVGRHLAFIAPPSDTWLVAGVVALGPLLGLAHFLLNRHEARDTQGDEPVATDVGSLPRWRRIQAHPNYYRLTKIAWLVVLLAALATLLLSPGLGGFLAQVTIGQVLAGISLTFGLLFFVYAARYYAIIALILFYNGGNGVNGNGHNGNGLKGKGLNGNGVRHNGLSNRLGNGRGLLLSRVIRGLVRLLLRRNGNGVSNGLANGLANGNGVANHGSDSNGFHLDLEEQPFVSVHLPIFNEESVVDRLLETCSQLDYENYEVIVADDSGDNTVRRLERWAKHPKVKISHRINRSGFKGAALKHAMEIMDPQTEFVVIFDADFIPPPQIIWQFLSYFFGAGRNGNGNGNGSGNGNGNGRPYAGRHSRYVDDKIAVVQGYQWHMLNADENWLTKGVRAEYSGSYVMERSGQELLGTMKMISGSVYMIRADVLRSLGWGTSITEDWELTLKLYLYGYKVLYTPFIQAPSECVSTFGRLVRQRMRWAEGHTFNVKKYFPLVMASPKLSLGEKLEFLYYAPYYLQSLFFTVGTTAWFLSEVILREGIPYWTSLLGWSLVLTNMGALTLMNLSGLFMERGVKREWAGALSAVALGMLLVPFQAYAALKGLLEVREGGWFRTPKTGAITEVIDKLDLGGKLKWLLPRRRKRQPRAAASKISRLPGLSWLLRRPSRLANTLIGGMAAMILVLNLFSPLVPVVLAAPDSFYLHVTTTNGATTNPGEDMTNTIGSGPTATKTFDTAGQNEYWYVPETWPTGGDDATMAAGSYTLNMYFNQLPGDSLIQVDNVSTGSTGGDASGTPTILIIPHTTSGTDRLMIVGVSLNNNDLETVTSVTYNGGLLTSLGAFMNSDDAYAELWYRVAPDAGPHDVVVTYSEDIRMDTVVGVITFTGVHQTTPLGAVNGAQASSGTRASVDVASAPGELVVDTVACETCTSLTADVGPPLQTERWNLSSNLGPQETFGGGSTEPGASPTVEMAWDFGKSDHWAITGVSIKPSLAKVNITASVHHTAANGSGATLITEASTTIDANTTDPLALDLGAAALQTFTSSDLRRMRLQINVTAISGGGSFVLAYDDSCSTSQCSNLATPAVVVPENAWLLIPLAALLPPLIIGMRRRRRADGCEASIHD